MSGTLRAMAYIKPPALNRSVQPALRSVRDRHGDVRTGIEIAVTSPPRMTTSFRHWQCLTIDVGSSVAANDARIAVRLNAARERRHDVQNESRVRQALSIRSG
ncbi:hypothetical protein [Burkholderia cenocepacia]|uniref:hypothetical protein n=1 Tax=Burkholderia cenocepacia TaxID=95486 RepID=UPI00196B6D25|nr:hypothetical protein [Burkholderia cenocepacia]MBN3566427.1 hypothetical protein [Burkholderia cenocepacia]MBR8109890.1 hypothetical protein [Burkholderia cenocepacia]